MVIQTTKKEEYFLPRNNSQQRKRLRFLKSFHMYFKLGFGNPAICPNIEIPQPFQVGVHQAKTSKGAPTPAVFLGLGHSQTPLTQFSCFCILTFFFVVGCKSSQSGSKIELSVWQGHVSCGATAGEDSIVHVPMETEKEYSSQRLLVPFHIPPGSAGEPQEGLVTRARPALHHFTAFSFILCLKTVLFCFSLPSLAVISR